MPIRFLTRTIIALLFLIQLSFKSLSQHQAAIKTAAQQIVKATVNNDFKTVVKYTYPAVIKMAGGQDKLIALMENGFKAMKAQGAGIKAGEIGEPGKIINTGKALYSIVPEKIIMEANGTKFYNNSSLLAISLNKGASWYFVDAGNLSDEQVKQLFPDAYGKIVIPKASAPVVIN